MVPFLVVAYALGSLPFSHQIPAGPPTLSQSSTPLLSPCVSLLCPQVLSSHDSAERLLYYFLRTIPEDQNTFPGHSRKPQEEWGEGKVKSVSTDKHWGRGGYYLYILLLPRRKRVPGRPRSRENRRKNEDGMNRVGKMKEGAFADKGKANRNQITEEL